MGLSAVMAGQLGVDPGADQALGVVGVSGQFGDRRFVSPEAQMVVRAGGRRVQEAEGEEPPFLLLADVAEDGTEPQFGRLPEREMATSVCSPSARFTVNDGPPTDFFGV
jgi:hypothetical protein